jgi:hypothetical protein
MYTRTNSGSASCYSGDRLVSGRIVTGTPDTRGVGYTVYRANISFFYNTASGINGTFEVWWRSSPFDQFELFYKGPWNPIVEVSCLGYRLPPEATTPTTTPAPTPVALANQTTLVISNAQSYHLASSTQIVGLLTTGGSGTGAVSFTAIGPGCSIDGIYLSSVVATTCVVTATKAASAGYNATSSESKSFTFLLPDQYPLTISNSVLTNTPGTSILLTTTGGSGTGAVTYSASGTGCSINGSILTSSTATSCDVIATKAASTGYKSRTSTPKSFVFVLPTPTPTPTPASTISGISINVTTLNSAQWRMEVCINASSSTIIFETETTSVQQFLTDFSGVKNSGIASLSKNYVYKSCARTGS